jgi:hypothetical protein
MISPIIRKVPEVNSLSIFSHFSRKKFLLPSTTDIYTSANKRSMKTNNTTLLKKYLKKSSLNEVIMLEK